MKQKTLDQAQKDVLNLLAKGLKPSSGMIWGACKIIRGSSKTTGTKYLRKRWKCECQCGEEFTVPEWYLIREKPKFHCGCLQRGIKTVNYLESRVWYMMHERCYNETHKNYDRYGGRGITICDRWNKFVLGDKGFENFLADMGPRKTTKLSIDRIDNDGIYEPSNCRWATAKQQRANQGSNK